MKIAYSSCDILTNCNGHVLPFSGIQEVSGVSVYDWIEVVTGYDNEDNAITKLYETTGHLEFTNVEGNIVSVSIPVDDLGKVKQKLMLEPVVDLTEYGYRTVVRPSVNNEDEVRVLRLYFINMNSDDEGTKEFIKNTQGIMEPKPQDMPMRPGIPAPRSYNPAVEHLHALVNATTGTECDIKD